MEHIIDSEREKYRKLFEGNYGHGYHGKKAHELIGMYNTTVLDVGCGRGEFVQDRRLLFGDFAVGTDIAAPNADIICAAHELPFRNKVFKWVTCFDVLEHIPPEYVNMSLQAMSRCSHEFVFSICYIASLPPEPCLHLSVFPQEWWIEQISRYGEVYDTGVPSGHHLSGNYLKGKWNV